MQHGQIIHVVNAGQAHISTLTITIRTLDNQTTTHTVLSATPIRIFIRDKLSNICTLPYFYIALVYLGKVIHPKKTFEEELVENGAEIVMVNVQEYAKKVRAKNVGEIVEHIRTEKVSVFINQKGMLRIEQSEDVSKSKDN